MLDLLGPADREVARVIISGAFGPAWNIDLFVRSTASDPVIFDAGEFSRAVGVQEGAKIVEIQVVTDVTIEVPIGRVSRVTFLCAPDLFAGFAVPPESGRTRCREAR